MGSTLPPPRAPIVTYSAITAGSPNGGQWQAGGTVDDGAFAVGAVEGDGAEDGGREGCCAAAQAGCGMAVAEGLVGGECGRGDREIFVHGMWPGF